MSLDAIFKAYDIRGVYPDEIDEALARRIGNAFAHFTGAPAPRRRPRHAAVVGAARAPRSSRARRSPAPTSPTSGSARPTSSTSPSGHLDAPGAMFTASHNPAQYNGIKLCRAGAAPDRRADRLAPDQGDGRVRRDVARRGRRQGRAPSTCSTSSASTCARSSTRRCCGRSRSWPTPPTAWAASSCPRCSKACRSRSRSSTASSTARSRTTPPTRSSPRTSRTSSARCSTSAPTSGSRSTATPTACSSSTTRASPVSGSTTTAIVAAGILDRHPGETIVHNLICSQARARGHPRARRHAGAHARRALVHQAGDGRDRRDLRRRALRALLLPRQLAGRLRLDRGAVRARAAVAAPACRSRSCASRSSATCRAARSTRGSTIPPR